MVFWKSWSFNIKFSLIAFFITAILGLLSMGALGGLLYYPVSFLFASYPTLNDWSGDWVWPSVIMVGMLWSFGCCSGLVLHSKNNPIQGPAYCRISADTMVMGGNALVLDD